MNNIDTLLFDVGDVLIDIDWQRGYRKMLGKMKHPDGTDLSLEEITEKLHPGPYGSVWDDFGTGALTQDEFLDLIRQRTGYNGDKTLLITGLTELFEPLEHRITLLNRLITGRNLTIALVSDTNKMHMDHIESYIPSIFQNIPEERRFYSHRLGQKKKLGKGIYETVLKALNKKPENALMIDDRLQNKPGADEIGLNFLHIEKHQDLGAALRQYAL
jgi:putative hydrolase of the HAD superfamily